MKPALILGLAVASLGLVSLPLRDCSLCGSVVRRRSDILRPDFATRCPRCRDGGRVSSWPRPRFRIDPLLRELIENPPPWVRMDRSSAPPGFSRALVALLDRQGAPRKPLDASCVGEARFGVCDEEDVVLVLLHGRRAEAWMLDLRGNVMDHFDTLLSAHDGAVMTMFAENGAGLHLFRDAGLERRTPKTITVRQDGRPPRVVEESSRILLGGGKFILQP